LERNIFIAVLIYIKAKRKKKTSTFYKKA